VQVLPQTAGGAREGVRVWAAVLATLALFKVAIAPWLPWGASITGALAVGLFLWAPTKAGERAGRDDPDWLTTERWRRDVAFALLVMLAVFPLFVAGFRFFLWMLEHVVPDLSAALTPYGRRGASPAFAWRAPPELLDKVAGNIAVALGEEFFYRGYLLRRLSETWPARTRLLGAPFGRAAWAQTGLFAAGHLLTFQPYRLATFFPGLLFTWMAARTGRVLAPAIVHAASNLLIATLEASAFG
jgi:hypothetical protein